VLVRVKSLIRRLASNQKPASEQEEYTLHNLSIHRKGRQVIGNGKTLSFTLKEFDLQRKSIPVDPNETFEGQENTKTNENLIVMDLSGKVLSIVDEGQEIGGVGRSLDSKNLAYEGGKNTSTELYISDVYKPQPKLVAVNILGLFADYDSIKWSPSGNKLLINGYSDPINGPDCGTPVLHIITLGPRT
jgi:hypothetical protein